MCEGDDINDKERSPQNSVPSSSSSGRSLRVTAKKPIKKLKKLFSLGGHHGYQVDIQPAVSETTPALSLTAQEDDGQRLDILDARRCAVRYSSAEAVPCVGNPSSYLQDDVSYKKNLT
jgi:hypothetical protein